MMLTIKATTAEASKRLIRALVEILTPTELSTLQKKIAAAIGRMDKQRAKRKGK